MLGQRALHRGGLEPAKPRFTVLDEYVRDAEPSDGLDVGVGVTKPDAKPTGERAPDGRLAGTGRTDDDDPRRHQRMLRCSR